MHDTEDKNWWVIKGDELEKEFISRVVPTINIQAIRNPDKDIDPTVPDILLDADNKIADIKTQNTRFLKLKSYITLIRSIQ